MVNKEGTRIEIFEKGIVVDRELPKYTIIEKTVEENRKKQKLDKNVEIAESEPEMDIQSVDSTTDNKIDFKKFEEAGVRDLNIYVHSELFNNVFNRYSMGSWEGDLSTPSTRPSDKLPKKSLWRRLSEKLHSKEFENIIEFDVFQFFTNVKQLTEDSVNTYTDRILGYIIALKNVEQTGQKALKEKLLRNIVINRYESILYARGIYHVVFENELLEFYKKSEKGVNITYIKNFIRPLPPEVVDKIVETNKLEIFDNYVILHYDPEKKSYQQTLEEKKKEYEKRRDPILFGVIQGSDKLYYITDWIDEYCDLTLDKFAEILQVDKDTLKLPAEIKVS